MMPMMLAKGASIISIIGGPFLHFWPPMRPMTPHWGKSFLTRNSLWASGLVFKTARAHDAHLGGSWGPQKCLKNPSVPWGFAVGAQVNFGAVSGWGPGGARGETEVR